MAAESKAGWTAVAFSFVLMALGAIPQTRQILDAMQAAGGFGGLMVDVLSHPAAYFVGLFGGIWFIWHGNRNANETKEPPRKDFQFFDKPPEQHSDEPLISMEYEIAFIPPIGPQGGRIRSLQFFVVPEALGIVGGIHEQVYSGPVSFPPSPNMMLRCRISNHGSVPIFNVATSFRVSFAESTRVSDGKALAPGKVILTNDWPITPDKIEPQSPYEFYVNNISPYFVRVELPEYMTAQIGSDAHNRRVRLRLPNTPGFNLVPNLNP